jgi:hypothetical protein
MAAEKPGAEAVVSVYKVEKQTRRFQRRQYGGFIPACLQAQLSPHAIVKYPSISLCPYQLSHNFCAD